MTPTPAAIDFRKPPPGDLEQRVEGWLAEACRRSAAAWGRLLTFPAALQPGPVRALGAAHGLDALPANAIGYPVTVGAAGDGEFVLAMPRPLVVGLLSGLLGETPTALPTDREPTGLEASVIGYMLRELFLDPLEKGWPLAEPLRLTAGDGRPPWAAWAGAGEEIALTATLTVAAPFGNHPAHLLLPRSGRVEELARSTHRPPPSTPFDRGELEAVVREMAVDLSVVLGTAELTMGEVAWLRAGDVIVLRRKVEEPLDGLVAGAPRFRVWPGAVGSRAAVRIHAALDETT